MSSSPPRSAAASRDAARPSLADEAAVGPEMQQEIYTSLGAMLGMLEVMASDTREPLGDRHSAWLREALRLGHTLKSQVEALVFLCSRGRHVERRPCSLRRVLEHAVRGASWGGAPAAPQLDVWRSEGLDELEIVADAQWLERMLRGIAECLIAAVGHDGAFEVEHALGDAHVELAFQGRRGPSAPVESHLPSEILCAAWAKVAALHGGTLALDAENLRATLTLPRS